MNRVAKTSSLVAMLLTLASGTAWAVIECTSSGACRGTDGPNTMYGLRSKDRIYGKGGSDEVPTRSTAVPTTTYCTAPETGRLPTRCAEEAGSTSATSISTTG